LPLNKGDIVYGREGERWGLACLIPQSNKYCLGQRIMQFRCNQDIIIPEFAMYALTSAFVRRQGELDTIGSTSPHVNISTICNYRIPTPLIGEQNKIVAYLDQKCSDIDALIAKKTQFLTELENYKKSLIYEYVTGKKEVLW
jgi:type I restriction enzyme S subunit